MLRHFSTTFRPSEAEAATWCGAGIPIRSGSNYSVTNLYYLAIALGIVSLICIRDILDSKIGLVMLRMPHDVMGTFKNISFKTVQKTS